MANKLTCKMSDGTEWEVRCHWNQISDDQSKVMVVTPIKREPREWFAAIQSNGLGIGQAVLCGSKNSAAIECKESIHAMEVIKVREVIE